MGKVFLLFFLPFFCISLNGQKAHSFSVSLNHPVLFPVEKTSRRLGIEVGYLREITLGNKMAFNYGLSLDFCARFNYKVEYLYYAPSMRTGYQNRQMFRLGLNIPVLINYRIQKFRFSGGFNLFFNGLVYYHKEEKIEMIDPEIMENYYPENRVLGISCQFRSSYQISEKLSPFIDLQKPVLHWLPNRTYGLLNVGVLYRLGAKSGN